MWALLTTFFILMGPYGTALCIAVVFGLFAVIIYDKGLSTTVNDGYCEQSQLGETLCVGKTKLSKNKLKQIKHLKDRLKSVS